MVYTNISTCKYTNCGLHPFICYSAIRREIMFNDPLDCDNKLFIVVNWYYDCILLIVFSVLQHPITA